MKILNLTGVARRIRAIVDKTKSWLANRWRWVAVTLAIILVTSWAGYFRFIRGWPWAAWVGFESRTLWDWMELLVVPIALAGGAIWFNQQQRRFEIQFEEQRAKRDREMAERRYQVEQEIETDRHLQSVLQDYLDRMTSLLLERQLRTSMEDSEVRDIARAQTLTALRRLDGERKGLLLRFLFESGLVADGRPVIEMSDAELSFADLDGAILSGINLRRVVMWVAKMRRARLDWANLEGASLTEADLYGAVMGGANLRGANLDGANLECVYLCRANLRGAAFTDSSLIHSDEKKPRGVWANLKTAVLRYADLRYAHLCKANMQGCDLFEADLSFADLREAYLFGARLQNADLFEADLSGANLSFANLAGAFVSPNQLASARLLCRAIMPDGSVHE